MRRSGRGPETVQALRVFPALHTGAQLHALANTLSAAGALLRRRPDAAEDLLAHLAAYLRDVLGLARPLVPVTEELRLSLALVGVERARLGGRLRLEVACTRDALAGLIPPLAIHALVENAIRHGITHRPGGGRIRILGRTAGGILHLAVCDDGPGMRRPTPGGGGSGWGLTGLRLRLAALWGSAARLRIICPPDAGTIAAISVPIEPLGRSRGGVR